MTLREAAAEWHALSVPALFEQIQSRPAGLTEAEARARLAHHGPNRLPEPTPPALWQIVLRQFRSPLIYILAAAAIVSLLVAHRADAAFIAAVLVLNAAIGALQEWRAERHTRALQTLLQIRASVERDGEVREVGADQVVPGDIVRLESGNRVPADMRLVVTQGLEVDESLLTGESLPVLKQAAWRGDAALAMAERRNMAYGGSMVVRGRSKGVVVATGSRTAIGQLALDVQQETAGQPPLVARMEAFTRFVGIAVLAAAAAVALIGVLGRGYAAGEMVLFAIALAVSAIPEGLPVALTVALAIATARMARRGVIVRRLAAVEGLGSCTLIASDKTGTLTCNELTVREACVPSGERFEITGHGFAPEGAVLRDGRALTSRHEGLDALGRAAVLCNEGTLHRRDGGWTWRGDPTDLALLAFGHKVGWTREAALDRYPPLGEIPFEPEQRFAASFHDVDGGVSAVVKGGPERVLAMCAWADEGEQNHQLAVAEAMAARGYRVLALAEGPVAGETDRAAPLEEPTDLQLLGFVGLIDPLRVGARDAVAACQAAGISVCMITGDHPVTALAIARDLGLASSADEVVTGADLSRIPSEELPALVKRVRVFARTTPRQKLQLVESARAAGHFVAVTGDGVNDAPALRTANIGVAMGRAGTDVAREAAALVITDDNFATIVSGVEEGRVAYENVRKVIYLLISTGAAEVVLLMLAMATGWPSTGTGIAVLPLLPVQLLWLNLVTNGIQDVALALEPGEGDELERPPRPPQEPIFNRLMLERTVVGAVVIATVAFAAFGWMIAVAGMTESSARNALLLLMVLFENVHIGNCRSETKSAFVLSPLRSPVLLGGTITAFLVHVTAMHLPLAQRVLHVQPVGWALWVTLPALALTVLAAMELHKWTWRRRRRAPQMATDRKRRR